MTNVTNSLDKSCHRLNVDAPKTFLIPTSLARCPATKDARPNKPRQEMNTAKIVKNPDSLPIRSSAANFKA